MDSGKAPASHTHDDRYYTEAEVNSLISNVMPMTSGGTTLISNEYVDSFDITWYKYGQLVLVIGTFNICKVIPNGVSFFMCDWLPYKSGMSFIGRARCQGNNGISTQQSDWVNLFVQDTRMTLYTGTTSSTVAGSYRFIGCYLCG